VRRSSIMPIVACLGADFKKGEDLV